MIGFRSSNSAPVEYEFVTKNHQQSKWALLGIAICGFALGFLLAYALAEIHDEQYVEWVASLLRNMSLRGKTVVVVGSIIWLLLLRRSLRLLTSGKVFIFFLLSIGVFFNVVLFRGINSNDQWTLRVKQPTSLANLVETTHDAYSNLPLFSWLAENAKGRRLAVSADLIRNHWFPMYQMFGISGVNVVVVPGSRLMSKNEKAQLQQMLSKQWSVGAKGTEKVVIVTESWGGKGSLCAMQFEKTLYLIPAATGFCEFK